MNAAGGEGALEASGTRLQALFNQVPAFIALHEGPDHIYVFSNPLHDQIAGGRPLIGKRLREAFPELEGQGTFERFDRVYQTGGPDVRHEMPAAFRRTPDGPLETGYFNQVLCPWRAEDGAIRGVMSFAFEVTGAVRAQQRLEESERRAQQQLLELDTLHQTAPIGMGLVDTDLRYVRVNERLAAINGVPAGDHVGRRVRDVLPELAGTIEPLLRRVIASKEPILEIEVQGTTPQQPLVRRDWLVSYYPVRDPDGEVRAVGSVVLEVTERRRTAAALRESEERYRVVAETASDALITADETGTILFVNPAAEKIFGHAREAMLGQNLTMLMPEYLRRVHEAAMARYLETGERHLSWESIKLPGLHESGREIPLEVSFGEYAKDGTHHFTSIVRDVTERNEAEAALRESEARFRGTFENAAVGIAHVDRRGRWTYVNEKLCAILGYTREELLARTFGDVSHPDDVEASLDRFRRLMRGEIAEHTLEKRYLHKDGHVVWVRLTASLQRDAVGEPQYNIAVIEDVTDRKQAEEALRNARIQITSALAAGAIATWNWDIPHDRVFGDRVLAAWFGVPEEEAEGRAPVGRYLEAIHPTDRERVAEAIGATVERGGEYAVDYRIEPPGRPLRWMEARGRVERDGAGQPARMVGVLVDVTERRRAEAALRESEARFRALFSSIDEGYALCEMVLDADGRPVDYRFLEVNPLFEAMTGLTDAVGRTAYELVPGLERHWVETFTRVALGGEPLRFEQGSKAMGRWFDVFATPVEPRGRFAIVFEDVTERRQAEQALRESEARFRSTFENAAVGMAHVGTDGSWLRVNDRLCEIVGYSRAELLEKTFQDITHPDDLGNDMELFGRLMRGEIESYQMEKRYFHKAGHVVWIDLTVALQRSEAGEALYSISVVQDISARKRIERELVEAKEQAEEMARLKSVFLANMSHEIRTPLTGILGFASLLARRVPASLRTYTERIETAGRRLLDTLNAVLTLAKLEADRVDLDLEPLGVAGEVKGVVELFRASAKAKGLRLVFRRGEAGAAEAEALLDRGAFASVLQNLLSNAIKFTDHGHVTITVAADPPGDGPEPSRVRVCVEDTGIGIDAAFVPYLFDEFRQESSGASRSYEGAGLGLALAKRLTELMHGALEVESEKGGGSRFTASFPLLERTSPPPEAPAAEQAAEAPPARLLVVEDNADARLLMRELLEEAYELTLAASADEAVAAAERRAHDLVLLDVNLGPGGSGEDVLARLRQMPAYREVPIVALTAHGLPGDRERFLQMGFTDHLAKPFDVDALLERAATLTAYPSQEA